MMGVKVLEVMDAQIDAKGWKPMIEAREAVAELIEAAESVSAHEEAAIEDEWDRLRLALARCNGGAA